jgi:hypothetical protein
VNVRTTQKDANGKATTVDAPKQITLGLRGDEAVEVVAGLTEGQQVVSKQTGVGGLPGGIKLPGGGGLGGGLG